MLFPQTTDDVLWLAPSPGCKISFGKSPKNCSACVENEILEAPVDVEYFDMELQFDPVSLASYRAQCSSMKEVGNMMNNINRTINSNLQQEKTWKNLVKVEIEEWEIRHNKDSFKSNKR